MKNVKLVLDKGKQLFQFRIESDTENLNSFPTRYLDVWDVLKPLSSYGTSNIAALITSGGCWL